MSAALNGPGRAAWGLLGLQGVVFYCEMMVRCGLGMVWREKEKA